MPEERKEGWKRRGSRGRWGRSRRERTARVTRRRKERAVSAAGDSLCGKREAENFMTEETWDMEQKLRDGKV